jgi:hypothetical protein
MYLLHHGLISIFGRFLARQFSGFYFLDFCHFSGHDNNADLVGLRSIFQAHRKAMHAISPTQIRLNWRDNNGNEAGFRVARSPDGKHFSLIASTRANATSYTNSGLTY